MTLNHSSFHILCYISYSLLPYVPSHVTIRIGRFILLLGGRMTGFWHAHNTSSVQSILQLVDLHYFQQDAYVKETF